MSLAVPPVAGHATQAFRGAWNTQVQPVEAPVTTPEDKSLEVKFDVNRHELIFEESQSSPVQKGEWVVVTTNGKLSSMPRMFYS
jgi:ubiquitin-conjugating enzyme E2 Q